eukprot:779904-Prymnesium_polylepis.2
MGQRRTKNTKSHPGKMGDDNITDEVSRGLDTFKERLRLRPEMVEYGSRSIITNMAVQGNISALFVCRSLVEDSFALSSLREYINAYGGKVHVVPPAHPILTDVCGLAALLRYPNELVDLEQENTASGQEASETASEPAAPCVARTLSRWAPSECDLASQSSSLSTEAIDELELLSAMFAADRKMRLLTEDGSSLLLLVDSQADTASWCVLDITLSPAYPHNGEAPTVRVPFGSVHGRTPDASSFATACRRELQ